jgi:hypothetical protein
VTDRDPLKIRAAKWAGTALRVGGRPAVTLGRMVPGVAGAAAISVGAGVIVGHVFGHGLALWVGLVVGGVFAVRIGAEINAPVPVPPRDPD